MREISSLPCLALPLFLSVSAQHLDAHIPGSDYGDFPDLYGNFSFSRGALLAAAVVEGDGRATTKDPGVISVFGSSVADGAFCKGNCSGRAATGEEGGCYQSRLREYQKTDKVVQSGGRNIFNNCHGGDTTVKLLARFDQMLSSNAAIVFIGLSLSNEGIAWSPDPDQIFLQYETNMHKLINQSRANGVSPVIGLCCEL